MDDVISGKKLREMRINAGKTVQEVSEYLKSVGHKAATQTIYGWERGHSQPTIDAFLEMCKFYGITDIFSHFGEPPTEAKNSPSAAEAVPGEAVSNMFDRLNDLLVSMGLIKDGDDLTTQQAEVLLAICRIINATFQD